MTMKMNDDGGDDYDNGDDDGDDDDNGDGDDDDDDNDDDDDDDNDDDNDDDDDDDDDDYVSRSESTFSIIRYNKTTSSTDSSLFDFNEEVIGQRG